MIDRNAKIPINCPNCGKKIVRTVRQFQSKPKFACPHCGQGFDATKFVAGLKEVDKEIKKFGGKFRL